MLYNVGLDVALEHTSVCVVDKDGGIRHESRVVTDPHDIASYFEGLGITGQEW